MSCGGIDWMRARRSFSARNAELHGWRTGADGAFRAEWLPAGQYRVIAVSTSPPRKSSVLLTIGAGADRVQNLTLG